MRTICIAVVAVLLTAAATFAAPPAAPYTWKNVTIVAGGFLPGIVFSPAQKGLAYVRTDIGGFYRSNDAGQHWTPLTDWVDDDHGNYLGGESIAPDPHDPNVVYAAAGMYSSNPAAMLRSHDQGRNWQITPMPIHMGGNEDGRGCGERLAVDPHNNKTLFFGSRYDGLWKSEDASVTWHRVDSFPKLPTGTIGNWRDAGYGIGFILFDPRNARMIYAGVSQSGSAAALYRSDDSGATWRPVPGLPEGLIAHHGALDADGSLYLTLGDKPGPNGVQNGAVFKLDTATNTWTDITPDKPNADRHFGYAGLCLDHQNVGTLVVTTADRWNPGDDVFRTTDGGKTWKPIKPTWQADVSLSSYLKWGKPQPREGWWMDAVAIDPFDSNHVMYGTGATIYGCHDIDNAMTAQPTHWTVEANGIEETAAIALISPPTGAHLVSALGDVCGFVHDDFAVSPPRGMMSNPIDDSCDSIDFAQNKPNIMVRTGDKPAAISTDGGRNWNPFASQPLHGRGNSIAISADGTTIVWANERHGIYFSPDLGKTWNQLNLLPKPIAVVCDRVNPTLVYALTTNSMFDSYNGGRTFNRGWYEKSFHVDDPTGRLVASPNKERDLWIAADGGGLLHTATYPAPFTRIPAVQKAKRVALGAPAAGHTNCAVYLAGTISNKSSIYRSDDDGATWVRLEDDAHQFGWLPDALAADPRVYGRVYLGTNGRGILYGEPANPSSPNP